MPFYLPWNIWCEDYYDPSLPLEETQAHGFGISYLRWIVKSRVRIWPQIFQIPKLMLHTPHSIVFELYTLAMMNISLDSFHICHQIPSVVRICTVLGIPPKEAKSTLEDDFKYISNTSCKITPDLCDHRSQNFPWSGTTGLTSSGSIQSGIRCLPF